MPFPFLSHSPTHSLKQACSQGRLVEASLALSTLSHKSPSEETCSSILDLCASQKAARQGQQIHSRIIKSVGGDSCFLETKLLFMYGKCGYISDAQNLFDGMLQRSVFTWNALIGAYVSNGFPVEAIGVYLQMRILGASPDACTFASVLKAFGAVNDLDCGVELHGLGIKSGVISNVFVSNALVTMYAKCGDSEASMKLFHLLPEKTDVVSWNSVISACLLSGEWLEALEFFRQVIKAGIGINSYTFLGGIQACTELFHLKLGREIHAVMIRCNRDLEKIETNALLVMYARCDDMDAAVRVFKEMHSKDNISWNSLLSGYVHNGSYEKALQLFAEMQTVCFHPPDQVSVITVASALGRLTRLRPGMQVHAYAVKHGLHSDLQLSNTLMDMYTKCSCFEYAHRIFGQMIHRDYISWTTAVTGYAQKGRYSEALDHFRRVQREEGMKVDAVMIGSILLACSGLKCSRHTKQIHCYTIKHGLLDLMLENSFVDVYGDCGETDYANKVFRNVGSKDVISWTSMISCYVRNQLYDEAIFMFRDMIVKAKLNPDAVALNSILAAIAGCSCLRKGKEVHCFLVRKGFGVDESIATSLVDMYGNCGSLEKCYKVFEMAEPKCLVLWTCLINACGMHGRGKDAIVLFERMLDSGLVPDHVAFLGILYACCHSGLVKEGMKCLDDMKNKYCMEPWPDHYACIVDLLGRSGSVEEAYEFIQTMPFEPTSSAWCALLGACRVHPNHHKIAEIASSRLLEMEPENPGCYVLISNVFASAGRWDEVEDVRVKMQEIGLRKNPGCSWMEIGNRVHSFTARDKSHPDSLQIYSKLDEITRCLQKNAGYVGNTQFILHNVGEDDKLKMLYGHSERLAIAYGLISTTEQTTIRITKNLRVCADCHHFTKLVSKWIGRVIIVRDTNRFHHFEDGLCSCGDFW